MLFVIYRIRPPALCIQLFMSKAQSKAPRQQVALVIEAYEKAPRETNVVLIHRIVDWKPAMDLADSAADGVVVAVCKMGADCVLR